MAQKFVCEKKSWIGSAVHFNVKVGVGKVCLVGVWSLYRLRDSTRDRKRITSTCEVLFHSGCDNVDRQCRSQVKHL